MFSLYKYPSKAKQARASRQLSSTSYELQRNSLPRAAKISFSCGQLSERVKSVLWRILELSFPSFATRTIVINDVWGIELIYKFEIH